MTISPSRYNVLRTLYLEGLDISSWKTTLASEVLKEFGKERRRVISDWRILLAARRLAHSQNAWLPDVKKSLAIRQKLQERGDIASVEGVEGIFVVEAPYANLLEVSEEQKIQEANPWAVFGFLTAMVHHGITDLMPREIYTIRFKEAGASHRIPLGTSPEDWVDIKFPTAKQPKNLGEIPVVWTEIRGSWEFGVTVGYSFGSPIYMTDLERTLLDALRSPEKCGGIAKVLQAWRSAESLNVDRLIDYTDTFGIKNLRQRVGFLLEKLGLFHPRLVQWRSELPRGGSLKLLASAPYSENYAKAWNLSLNVPRSVLAILEEE